MFTNVYPTVLVVLDRDWIILNVLPGAVMDLPMRVVKEGRYIGLI
tara:strand:+ start:1585 stop:1719 length:135 start_codon:yes stop_codon:yes gene_type:complete